jgi:predicted dithiol-disulfide oxidoreductase (DUF899 family)
MRMNWISPFVSSYNSDFNYDFNVSFIPEQNASDDAYYDTVTLGWKICLVTASSFGTRKGSSTLIRRLAAG